jgi:two-component system chemotaxis response regulator CheB
MRNIYLLHFGLDWLSWSGLGLTMNDDEVFKPLVDQPSPAHFKGAFDIVALAASAGGLRAISEILAVLPADFLAAIVVVQHLDPRHRSLMADILSRRTALKVKEAQEGARLNSGMVYIAPSNRHLLVNPDGTLSLTQSELVHFVRPSADLLFESVAASYKERAIAVVLSGTGSDGSMGVKAIKKMGGTVIVQDERVPSSSECPAPLCKPAVSISFCRWMKFLPR